MVLKGSQKGNHQFGDDPRRTHPGFDVVNLAFVLAIGKDSSKNLAGFGCSLPLENG